MARRIKLQADYDTDPLWDLEEADYLYLSDLPLSPGLVTRLERWQDEYDSLLNLLALTLPRKGTKHDFANCCWA